MFIAACLAAVVIKRWQADLSISKSDRWTLAASGFVFATFGAKLPFLIFGQDPSVLMGSWLGDGKTVLWGLASGYLGVEVGKWMLDIRVRTGDTFVVGIALAIGLGRIGCLLFGCCYGTPTELPWGITFVTSEDRGTLPRHPTQIYESIFHIGFAILALTLMKRGVWKGNWMPIYLVAYCIYRFASEFIRPEQVIIAGLTFYQLSAVIIASAMLAILYQRTSKVV